MITLAKAWEMVLENKYSGVENAIPAFQNDESVLLVQNMGTVLEPIVGISLRLESSQATIDDLLTQTKGFSIEKQEFSYEGNSGYFAVLKCAKKNFNQHFILFAEKLLDDVSDNVKPSIALKNFTKRWEEFFSKLKSKRLSDEEIIGLYGELLIMQDLLEKFGTDRGIVEAWQGPLANAWDFLLELPNETIQFEVKTSASSRDHASINGLKQLQEMDVVKSFLCLQKIHVTKVKMPSQKNTLMDLIHAIKSKLEHDQLAISLFEELINELGEFNEEHDAHCRLLMFQTRARQWYLIDKDFPALTSLTLSENLRQRVSDVKYTLELAGLEYSKVTFPF